MEGLPESVGAELAQLRAEWAESGLDASLDKLMQRPAMPGICRTLAEHLSGPQAWRNFFFAVLEAANFAHLYFQPIKPDRQAFEKHRGDAIRAARELAAALGWLTDSFHGHNVPGAVNFFWFLSYESARAKGYSEAAANALSIPFSEDLETRLQTRMDGRHGPAPFGLPDLLATLAEALEAWNPETDSQGQGTAPGPVFVRALDDNLAKRGLDAKALLTDEQMADLTRAAMGMSDEFDAKGNRFGPGNVRDARRYAKK